MNRFATEDGGGKKVETTVEFPIKEFDITERIKQAKANKRFAGNVPKVQEINDNDGKIVYNLCAVDNHFGSLHRGHYTAYSKNQFDNKWYYFDDSRVIAADVNDAISGNAYLLFYKRRSTDKLEEERADQSLQDIADPTEDELRQKEEKFLQLENKFL